MILFFRNFSHVHSMISPRILIQIQWFLFPWIHLRVLFPKISKPLISIHISSSNLIKFKKIIWNYPNSLWIRPLFTTIPLNSCLFPKIGEFSINFDSWPCVFNDLAVSIRQLSVEQVEQGDSWLKVVTTHLGQKMPSNPKTMPNYSSLE